MPSKPFIGIPTNSGWMPFAASKGIVSASAVFCHSGSGVMFKADEASIANSMAAIAAAFVSANVADRATGVAGWVQTDGQPDKKPGVETGHLYMQSPKCDVQVESVTLSSCSSGPSTPTIDSFPPAASDAEDDDGVVLEQ